MRPVSGRLIAQSIVLRGSLGRWSISRKAEDRGDAHGFFRLEKTLNSIPLRTPRGFHKGIISWNRHHPLATL